MGKLIADVFVTVKPVIGRLPLTVRSLRSLRESIDPSQYRLTICLDGRLPGIPIGDENHEALVALSSMACLQGQADYVLQSSANEGLGPTINRAIAHIKSINDWYAHPTHGDLNLVAPYVVMCQDDLLYSKDWLPILASRFRAYGMRHSLGFATGHLAVEHSQTIRQHMGEGIHFQDWIRATSMLGTREYWESLMPIPRLDPETGRVRARPNDGMGSGVDWWLIRNHPNSVCRTGRTCLVVPGLVQHIGYDRSTWLDRELPESDSDKERMRNV